ncbi:neutral/alkaline non-lysosomal ceramidase N-terminal domain-containing protein [Planctomicrobium sp. SH664]|uniref:neutral/alkaline non-lysosomal ceramidase N-terminal domain-containing protein n=1 Tax=Planctomicrobium sp. SH664 TaxID=3448125 RepID=UPI003F5ADFCB
MHVQTQRFDSSALRCLAAVVAIAVAWGSGQATHAEDKLLFRAGAATSNITPALGKPLAGTFYPGPSTHIHDELHARCIVLDDGKTQLALVVCDLVGLPTAVCREAQRSIEKTCGIPASNVLISATHTHSANSALGSEKERAFYDLDFPLDEYQQFVAKRIADGVQRAKNLLRPAEFAFGTVSIPEHVHNRRWFVKPEAMPANPFGAKDLVKSLPTAGSPDNVKPAGPTDPEVSFLSFRQPDGAPIALLASYSLHYVGGIEPGHVSSDYYGRVCEYLVEFTGTAHQKPPFVPVMANGTSGDVLGVNFGVVQTKRNYYEKIDEVASDVATKVLNALSTLTYTSDVQLDARYRVVELDFRKPDDEMMRWAEKTYAAGQTTVLPKGVSYHTQPLALAHFYAKKLITMSDYYPDKALCPLQMLKIGNLYIGTMPCEAFCEIGLDFKKNCPVQPAFLMTLSHGHHGYVPPPHQHDLGGYEAWLGTNRLERDASEKMLNELYQMASEIQAANP